MSAISERWHKATTRQSALLGRLSWLLIPLLALPALWPLWRIGLPRTADGTLHLLRVALLDYHVTQGMLFPRWMPELVLGYGYPLFNFYGPVSYYLAEALHLLGLPHSGALIATFGLLIIGGGYGAYLLAHDMFSDARGGAFEKGPTSPALVAAVAYMYTPYLLTNVYMRGALAEVGAQALLPWIFWSFRRLLRGERPGFYVLPAALSLGGLAATHNITLLWIPMTLLTYIAVLWWQDRDWRALLWPMAGGAAALGVSAFFWLPLILERDALSGVAFDIAATYIGENVWSWPNFLDWHLPFDYTLSIPFQLGALQVALALVGFTLLRPKTAEWWYWLAVALLAMLGISSLALPLWLNSELLLIAQFPWRLLSIASLPLALFTGGLVQRLRPGLVHAGVTLALLMLIIVTQRPQANALQTLVQADRNLTPAEVAQFEADTNAFGTSSSSEFLPKWAGDGLFAPAPAIDGSAPAPTPAVTLTGASPFRLNLEIDAPAAGPLHFAGFYFPGWQATLNGAPIALYPEATRGLLTVDLPAGISPLRVVWTGTDLARAANAISLVTLAGLLALVIRLERRRPWRAALLALFPALLLLWGLGAARPAPPVQAVQQPATPLAAGGLRLLGAYTRPSADGSLFVYPTWLVEAASEDVRMAWSLVPAGRADGVRYPLTTSRPYFNTQRATNWLPATVFDDAYRLALPPMLPADFYELQLSLLSDNDVTDPVSVATLELTTGGPVDETVELPLGWRYGEHARLAGLNARVNGRPIDLGGTQPPVARPGDRLEFRLSWLADGLLEENYHAFLHLLDHVEAPLLQGDQLPGPVFSPPRLWNGYRAAPDTYWFTVPDDAASGLYRGAVGLYDFATGERLPVQSGDGAPLGDRGLLPPLKIVNPPPGRPATRVDAAFADLATLEGYTLELPADGATADPPTVHAGETFTLTLHYRADGPAVRDYTQFVHVYNPELGMAAQRDAMPGAGGNPTTAWTNNEKIVEVVPLTIAPETPPGVYDVLVGFYDAEGGAVRVPVTAADGAAWADGQVLATRVEVR